ncbi:MAG TPA: hypothetical protein VET24_15610 [Actinomycetota bacterium]|nr:hypothetical protein [Actinomycetota bacterium]
MDASLPNVILGWLLNWASCPEAKLSSTRKAEAAAARLAATEGIVVLSGATKEDLAAALDQALQQFPRLCPDVPEERRLRMAARLARILQSDRIDWALQEGVAGGAPAPTE